MVRTIRKRVAYLGSNGSNHRGGPRRGGPAWFEALGRGRRLAAAWFEPSGRASSTSRGMVRTMGEGVVD